MSERSKPSPFSEPQNIIAAGVTLISVCALVVSILQTRIMSEQRVLMYEQAKASVWPNLSLTTYKSHSSEDYRVIAYKLLISNGGVGPALIKGVRVSYQGEPVRNWWDLFGKFNLPDSVETLISNGSMNNTLIKIGEESMVLDLSNNLPLAQAYYEQAREITIEIFYESIYNERWKYTFKGDVSTTETVDTFNIDVSEQFEG